MEAAQTHPHQISLRLKFFERGLDYQRCYYQMSPLSLSLSRLDELVTTVRSVKAVVVAITEALQIIPEVSYIIDYKLCHHVPTTGGVMFSHKELSPSHLVKSFLPLYR